MSAIDTKTRRDFLKFAGKLGIFARVGGISSLGLSLSTRTSSAWIIAVLEAAALVAGLIGSFMRSDGGMGAMLSAINAKLDLIVEQLATIELALAKIVEILAELPDQIDENLKAELVADKLSTMKGAMSEYLEIQRALEARRLNGTLPRETWDADTSSKIEKLYDRFNGARRSLAENENGLRPDSAIFAPAAFIFDLAMNLVSRESNEQIVELARGYRDWFERIRDPKLQQSTAWHIQAASDRHTDALKRIASTAPGRALGFATIPVILGLPPPLDRLTLPIFRVPNLEQPEQKVVACFDATDQQTVDHPDVDIAAIISKQPSTQDHADVGISAANIKPAQYYEYVDDFYEDIRIWVKLSQSIKSLTPEITVQLFEYSFNEIPYSWHPGEKRPDGIPPAAPCQISSSYTFHDYADNELLPDIKSSPVWKLYLDDRKSFEAYVKAANDERLRIGLYTAAYLACAAASNAANEWITKLGGQP